MQNILNIIPLVAIINLLGSALGLAVMRLIRPKFPFYWLVSALSALISWTLILISRTRIPTLIPLGTWQPEQYFGSSPVLLIDGFSWPYAMSLVTLVLAVVLSDIVRTSELDWSSWASNLALVAIGLVAVMAGNQLTLLLAWAAIDLFELLVWMIHIYDSSIRERIVIAFSLRSVGLMLTLWGGGSGEIFMIAVALRLAVLPFHLPISEDILIRRGLGTVIRIVPAIASLVFVSRVAVMGVSSAFTSPLLIAAWIIAFCASILWLRAKDELDGRPFWVLGMSMISLAAAVRGQPVASMVLGISMLHAGALLYLYSARNRYLHLILLVGLLAISFLPFSPSWDAARLYTAPLSSWMLTFLIPQSLLILGYLRHAFRPAESLHGVERMVQVIYPWGLFLLPLTQFMIGYWDWRNTVQQGTGYQYPASMNPVEYWSGVLVLALIVLWVVLWRLFPWKRFDKTINIGQVLSLEWLFLLIKSSYHLMSRIIAIITGIFEGDGGILWTLLLLVLLFAFFSQGGLGR
jgi:hypothetical protein